MGVIVFIIGLVVGSFLGALSYRIPRGIKISEGRSECPRCGKQIAFYDNIPVLSYLLLKGRCRNCNKPISARYPFIELFTACGFLFAYLLSGQIAQNLPWLSSNNIFSLGMLLLIAFITIAVFVIDAEHQIIPDELIYVLWAIVLLYMVLNDFTLIYDHLAAGFLGALFLLFIHLITKGNGMGLGDVKLAVVMGTILGPINTILWFFISFIVGGFIGAFLLVLNRAKIKDRIAFGPFLIVSFFIVAIYGDNLASIFFPYL